MKKSGIILFIIVAFGFTHPYYLSVLDLKYNASEKALQGSVLVFTNDLEDALKRLDKKPVDLIHPRDSVALKKQLDGYLRKRLSLKVNGEPKPFKLIGFEREQENFFMYVEFKNCVGPKKITIENSVLYDFLKEQININQVEIKGQKKSSKVSDPEKKVEFLF